MLDWGIWVAFGKENFIKQFLVLHLILFSLQKVKMASTGCSSFSADSARVKRMGGKRKGRPGKQISPEESRWCLSPGGRQGARRPRSRTLCEHVIAVHLWFYRPSPTAAAVTMGTGLGGNRN